MLTDAEINKAIAEWCGWKMHPMETGLWLKDGRGVSRRLPNFVDNLNACRDAEKFSINVSNIEEYKIALCLVCGCDEKTDIYINTDALLFATARQRCEALLRVLGKWKE